MRMDRRTLLKTLLGLPIALTLDVEALLWTPRTLVTVPAVRAVTLAEINAVMCARVIPGIVDNFFKASPMLEYLTQRAVSSLLTEELSYS